MKITFLGTGTSQGVPVIGCQCNVCKSSNPKDNRLRTSLHIELNKLSIAIDSGPDFRYQMLRTNTKHLNGIIFTHEHKDHTGGLDDIRPFCFKQKEIISLYARQSVLEQIKIQYPYIFAKKRYQGVPEVKLIAVKNKSFKIQDLHIVPINVMHYKLPVFGYRFKDFTYITDASFIEKKELEKIKGTKIMVINGLRKEKHISHFTIDEAIEVVKQINPEHAYITHISHLLGLHSEINPTLPNNISLAYDGLELVV